METSLVDRVERDLNDAGDTPTVLMKTRDVKLLLIERKMWRDYATHITTQRTLRGFEK